MAAARPASKPEPTPEDPEVVDLRERLKTARKARHEAAENLTRSAMSAVEKAGAAPTPIRPTRVLRPPVAASPAPHADLDMPTPVYDHEPDAEDPYTTAQFQVALANARKARSNGAAQFKKTTMHAVEVVRESRLYSRSELAKYTAEENDEDRNGAERRKSGSGTNHQALPGA